MNSKIKSLLALCFLINAVSFAETMTDPRDGKTYRTIVINDQEWMAENLNFETRGSFCYEKSSSKCKTDGRLYTFLAAQNSCPEGWHLPSVEEANAMLSAIDFKRDFNFIPAGLRRDDDSYMLRGSNGYFWTNEGSNGKGKYFYGTSKDKNAKWLSGLQTSALSVRCVKDEDEYGEFTDCGCGGDEEEEYEEENTFVDSRDGKTYRTVTIGNQEWMAENLNYSVNPGTQSWCYDNKESNCDKYGRLYDWNAATNACPAGWHLPSKEEFEMLAKAAGGRQYDYHKVHWNEAGIALKSRSGWEDYNGKNGNGTNALGFAALPAGIYGSRSHRYDGFLGEGEGAVFWSSAENGSDEAYFLGLGYDEAANVASHSKVLGLSVRCIKN